MLDVVVVKHGVVYGSDLYVSKTILKPIAYLIVLGKLKTSDVYNQYSDYNIREFNSTEIPLIIKNFFDINIINNTEFTYRDYILVNEFNAVKIYKNNLLITSYVALSQLFDFLRNN